MNQSPKMCPARRNKNKTTKSTREESGMEGGGSELRQVMGRKLTALRNSRTEVSAGRQTMDLSIFHTSAALCHCCKMLRGFLRT